MTEQSEKRPGQDANQRKDNAKQERLAAALRKNLLRRKEAARAASAKDGNE